MQGWSSIDIGEYFGVSRQAVHAHFVKAVRRIVEANKRRWEECFSLADTSSHGEGKDAEEGSIKA